jgi:hypothetical protein
VPPGIGLTFPDPPELHTLRAGVDLFGDVILKGREPTASALAALGSILWWERAADTRAAAGDQPPPYVEETPAITDGADVDRRRDGVHPRPESSDREPEDEEPFAWTPERVARALARATRLAAHMQRKEIWQRMIAHCTIAWRGRGEDAGERVLAIGGDVVADRLRVLTTELRRLSAEGRLIEVRLAQDVTLTTDRVRDLLEWI